MNELLFAKKLERFNPAQRNLIRLGSPLADPLNPFRCDDVTLSPGIMYDSTFNSKAHVAYELIMSLILAGKITEATKVIAASSGNTGLGIAQLCKALGIWCEIVMQNDTPPPKVGIISALGNPIATTLLSSSTVNYARERAELPGWCNVDQYGLDANPIAHYKYFAPQLFQPKHGRIDVVVVAGGTLGTAEGLKRFIAEHGLTAKIVLAVCKDGHEVPGARDVPRIKRDVKVGSVDDFKFVMSASRYQSFLASYAMFAEVEWTQGGPTSGLALSVALRFLQQHKMAGTLDQFRGPDRKINVVFLCPDDYRLYGDLYRSTLNGNQDFFLSSIPIERLLLEEAA
jgi:cysteine synthase B